MENNKKSIDKILEKIFDSLNDEQRYYLLCNFTDEIQYKVILPMLLFRTLKIENIKSSCTTQNNMDETYWRNLEVYQHFSNSIIFKPNNLDPKLQFEVNLEKYVSKHLTIPKYIALDHLEENDLMNDNWTVKEEQSFWDKAKTKY